MLGVEVKVIAVRELYMLYAMLATPGEAEFMEHNRAPAECECEYKYEG